MRPPKLVMLLTLLASWQLPAQTTSPSPPRSRPSHSDIRIERARKIITDTMRALGAPGAAIAVIRDGRILWSEGFGLADIEQQVQATPRTVFRIGSVSKPITAVALGRLIEQGRIDLDAPVQRYVPGFPVKPYPVTVRQVAGHLAGIRHYRGAEFENQRHYATVTEGLSIFQDDSLLFPPGTRFSYSSYGWNLIAAVIEGASGEPFLPYMKREVFDRAGMTHTYPDFADSIIPFRADFYSYADSQRMMLNAPYVDNSYKWAGGGFLSTAEDLAHFGQVMLEGTLLKPETVCLLWTSLRTSDGKETNYGLGWGVGADSAGHRRIGHTGGAMGGTATLQIYPEEKLIIALLVNSDRTFIGIEPRIAAVLRGDH